MKILHQGGFNHTELLTNRQIIYRNLIDASKSIVQYLKDFDILPANPENLVWPLGRRVEADYDSEKCNIYLASNWTPT